MVKAKTVIGYAIVLLLSAGVIATLLAVLMSSGVDDPEVPQSPAEGSQPMEGDYVYSEVRGQGKLKGSILPQKVARFAGIPFSQPPVGEYRWQRPRTAVPFEHDGEYYDATYHRKGCAQNCTFPSPEYTCPNEISEDCLHLAVYVPSRLTRKVPTDESYYYELIDNINSVAMPVMVFLYGGAFIAGSNGVPLYDGRFVAEKGDVIVVVPNYRLGPFGFFYQDTGNSEAATGNFGIFDQIEALKWVQKHIRDFGGDPDQVTLFGQSAGAQSIGAHLVNGYSDPLFNRAILESNPFGITFKTKAEAQDTCDKFAKAAKCNPNDMVCLRGKSMEEIIDALNENNFPISDQLNPNSLSQVFEPWAPMLDDYLLFEHSFTSFKKGTNQNKPIIYGYTKDEGMFFIIQALSEPSKNPALYKGILQLMFGDKSDLVAAQYPGQCTVLLPTPSCDDRFPMDDLVTDYLFVCPTRNVFTQPSRFGNADLKVWSYTFDQIWSFPQFWQEYDMCYDLTCHSAELPYLFDLDVLTDLRFTEEESNFAERMIWYWSNFAKYGDPNGNEDSQSQPGHMHWPRMYEDFSSTNTYQTLKLTASGEIVLSDFAKTNCDVFDEVDLYLNDSIKLPSSEFDEVQSMIRGQNSQVIHR